MIKDILENSRERINELEQTKCREALRTKELAPDDHYK
jgi:hypothetical protein